jgi:membrane protease YdiL (CAAX protease family)
MTPNRSPGWALALVAAVTAASALWFHSPLFPRDTLATWQRGSGGWLSVTLVANLLTGLATCALLFGPGRQRPGDVGWRRGTLGPALGATLGLWALMQLATVVAAAAAGATLEPARAWSSPAGPGVALGPLLAQLLGTALLEETLCRGYLWPQLALLAGRWLPARHAGWAGLLASQLLFGLLHVPGRLQAGAAPGELAGMLLALTLTGLVLALLYAATDNLLFAVGVHALGNAPTPLFVPQGPPPSLVLLAGSLLLAGLWWHARRGRNGAEPTLPPAAAP